VSCILLDLITLTILREEYRLWGSSLCNFLHDPSSSLLGPNILLNTLFSETLRLCSSLKLTDQVSHPLELENKIQGNYNTWSRPLKLLSRKWTFCAVFFYLHAHFKLWVNHN
jgi:hypothetical protein